VGVDPVEIASEYGLTEQQVKECLAFYAARSGEIEANVQAEESTIAPDA
jgi:uncharacterized protein (DUF433 family)